MKIVILKDAQVGVNGLLGPTVVNPAGAGSGKEKENVLLKESGVSVKKRSCVLEILRREKLAM